MGISWQNMILVGLKGGLKGGSKGGSQRARCVVDEQTRKDSPTFVRPGAG